MLGRQLRRLKNKWAKGLRVLVVYILPWACSGLKCPKISFKGDSVLHKALNSNRRERRRKEDRTMIIKERRQVQYVLVSPLLSRMRQEGSVAGQPGRELLLRHGRINSCGRGPCESL